MTKGALKGAMDRLLKADRIHVETVGPPSKQRKTLVPGPTPKAAVALAPHHRAADLVLDPQSEAVRRA